ncbi:MAG: hypothetical protein EOP01_10710, partial [Propionibacteriaceae bacterium]
LIQTSDGRRLWTTVGVGQNVVEASWEALSDAYLYGLLHAESAEPSDPGPVDPGPAADLDDRDLERV